MSNLDARPAETLCTSAGSTGPAVELLAEREVPLGGIRGITVRRTLPQRALPTVGAWCFLDYFGPDSTPMRVLPHPHIGLQTVTWPLAGEVRHRDNLGSDVVLRPGELNLMTAGRGVAHSEFSVTDGLLQGLQLWVALPDSAREIAAGFEHYPDLPVVEHGVMRATVLVGEFSGASSLATVHSPLVGVDMVLSAGAVTIPLDKTFEHAVLVISGSVTIAGCDVTTGPLLYLGIGRDELSIVADGDARIMLLGGEPFTEELIMWWNFVGRTHEEIVQAREDWERGAGRFGVVAGHGTERIPAPPMPELRLTPRKRRP